MYLRLTCIFILLWIVFSSVPSADFLDEKQIKFELQQIKNRKNYINKAEIVSSLQEALHYFNESKISCANIEEYKNIINNFSILSKNIRNKNRKIHLYQILQKNNSFSRKELNQKLTQMSTYILCLEKELQEEQIQFNSIINSLIYLSNQKDRAQKLLNDIEKKIHILLVPSTSEEWARSMLLQAKEKYVRLKIKEFDFAQISANFRQELSRIKIDFLKKNIEHSENFVQILYKKLDQLNKQEYETISYYENILLKISNILPNIIISQIEKSKELFSCLEQQEKQIKEAIVQQRKFYSDIFRVYQTIYSIQSRKNILYESPIFVRTIRLQISELPKLPNLQQIDIDIANLEKSILSVKELTKNFIQIKKITQIYKNRLTKKQFDILNKQFLMQECLLKYLLTSFNVQILELTKLKVIGMQLSQSLIEVKKIVHQYLFWMADISPVDFSFFIEVWKNIHRFFTYNIFKQLIFAFKIAFKKKFLIILFNMSIIFIIFSYILTKHYKNFLEESSLKIKKSSEDCFSLTLQNIFFSILISFPFPSLLLVLGYGLQQSWSFLIPVSIGDSFIKISFLLWILIIFFNFSRTNGLFIKHFDWSERKVNHVLRYYKFSILVIIPLIMIIITFDKYNNRELVTTIERLCFILLCIGISIIFNNFKNFNLILYYDENSNNIINKLIWNIIIFSPIVCSFASILGYLSIAKILLVRFEISILTLFIILVIYYIFNRWMLIQRKRIFFERHRKHKSNNININDVNNINNQFSEIDKESLDLDTISVQSLKLVRSVFTLIALLSIIFLWSELRSAFGFLENIKLWNVSVGENSTQYITLSSVLIFILVLVITTKMVRNFPALLELSLLQYLNLTPGTGYAIITLTKYTIMFLGGLIGFTIIGIEWSKLQWLIAALGVGLGFGLQEMFANFISGLMILFEKPIRIGDTITIRNLTGNITCINTRATTITDWDKKEIIVPNKAFITEQFVNWSLSDTITRVVIHVPAPEDANIEQITKILLKSATDCTFVLKSPSPEVFLMDLQQGLPMFELRMYVAEMSHRMPLRHQVHSSILKFYRENNIELPFPPLQVRTDQIKLKNLSIK